MGKRSIKTGLIALAAVLAVIPVQAAGKGDIDSAKDKISSLEEEKKKTEETIQELEKLKADHDTVVTLEDGILNGGFGEKIARFYGSSDMKVYNYGLKKEFLDRYDVNEVLKENHLTAEQIVNDVL